MVPSDWGNGLDTLSTAHPSRWNCCCLSFNWAIACSSSGDSTTSTVLYSGAASPVRAGASWDVAATRGEAALRWQPTSGAAAAAKQTSAAMPRRIFAFMLNTTPPYRFGCPLTINMRTTTDLRPLVPESPVARDGCLVAWENGLAIGFAAIRCFGCWAT